MIDITQIQIDASAITSWLVNFSSIGLISGGIVAMLGALVFPWIWEGLRSVVERF